VQHTARGSGLPAKRLTRSSHVGSHGAQGNPGAAGTRGEAGSVPSLPPAGRYGFTAGGAAAPIVEPSASIAG
jgi:hypothetical protein